MEITINKWGNSLGFRLPANMVNDLNLNIGDKIITHSISKDTYVIKKKKKAEQIYEDFYGKPYNQITLEDLGECELMDWGADVGGEIIK